MAKYYGTKMKTPVGALAWVDIVDGSSYMGGAEKLKANVVFPTDSPECKKLMELIREEWKEHKPKGASKPKMPFRVVRERTEEEDENGDPVYRDTDKTQFSASTRKYGNDDQLTTINVFNAKGKKVSLGGQLIGNGSQGCLMVTAKVYAIIDKKSGVVGNCGVSLYLSGIQLAKFKPYTQEEDAPEALDGVSDGFEGVTEELEEVSEVQCQPETSQGVPLEDSAGHTPHIPDNAPTVEL